MAGIRTSIAISVLVVFEFSAGLIYDWSPCSRTCGKGTRSRKCQPINVQGCRYEYEDCKVKDCPIVQCTTYKYDSVSECCRDEDFNKCGVLQLDPEVFRRRIIGGNLSEDGQWPWQVAVKKKPNKLICGSSLLSERWILTAAHCFTDSQGIKEAKDGLVVAGITRLNGENPDKQTYEMEKFILHPNNTYWTHDLALVKVKIPIRYSAYVHPICLPDGDIVAQDTTCYVAGWGVANIRGPEEASIDLLHVGLRVLPLAVCEEAYRGQASSHAITNDIICAGILSGGKDTCSGDSGGPLVCQRMNSCQWFMAGMVSFGNPICGLAGAPAVYANVQKYQDWIDMTMRENSIPVLGRWQPCSKTCGSGIQSRIENCSSSTCPKEYRGCNTQPCPADCVWMEYSKYGSCKFISNGSDRYAFMKKRQRQQIKARHGGAPCVGKDHEYARCSSAEIMDTVFMRTITTAFPTGSGSGGGSSRRRHNSHQARGTYNRDVLFLLDESASVGSHHFRKRVVRLAKAVVGSFCGSISIGMTSTRVGVMNFDQSQYPVIDFDDYFSRAQLLDAMDTEIEYHQESSGATCLVDALEFARTDMFQSARGARIGVHGTERMVILVTDGCANCKGNMQLKSDLENLKKAVKQFAEQGISLVTFLVTGNSEYCFHIMRGLSDGSQCYQLFHAQTWTELDSIIKGIEEQYCMDDWYIGPMC